MRPTTPLAATRRRAFALSAGALLTPAAAFAQASGRTVFEVWRNGDKIGSHSVDITDAAGVRTARIAAEMTVRLGPVPVFRYRHSAVETWSAGRFSSLDARTTSNGKLETVNARREGGSVRILRNRGAPVVAPPEAAPLTHWNREVLAGPLFNPQTGQVAKERVTRREGDSVRLADGRTIPATRYALTGDAEIIDWYDAQGRWAGLRGKADDNSWIDYRRV